MPIPRRDERRTYLNKYEKRSLKLTLSIFVAGGIMEGGDFLILFVSIWCSSSLLSGPIARLVPGTGLPHGTLILLLLFA